MRIFKLISILMVITVAGIYIYDSHKDLQTFSGKIFGTYYNIKVRSPSKDNTLEEKIKKRLKEINAHMSVFDGQSEIRRINRAAAEDVTLSPSMSYLLKSAAQIYRESGGAFDPTIGKAVELWGFGVGKITRIPDEEKLRQVLRYVGFDKIKFKADYSVLHKASPEIYLNLSAIAKGYGVDEIARLLEDNGYNDYMVEIGGEIRASGTKDEHGSLWTVGVVKPSASGRENALVLDLTDYGIATSGDYRNFFYKDGRRYSHTISPQTGKPVEHNLASVTVFHPRCMMADAYATAIMALGEEKGLAFAEKYKLPVILFIRGRDDAIVMKASSAARSLIGE